MYTLIVKGDEAAAFAACSARKVEVTSIVHHPKFDECIVTTPSTNPGVPELLGRWFNDYAGVPPAPAGTLMWYGPAKRSVFNGNLIVPPRGWDIIEGGNKEDNR